jgi:surface antigen
LLFFSSISTLGGPLSRAAVYQVRSRVLYRIFVAMLVSLMLTAGMIHGTRPAYAAYNCVNVVFRDPYWGQFRGIVESAGNAAGIGSAFGRRGWTVNNTPSAGAVMVWPAGYFGASGIGHVGVVVEVRDDGFLLVRHENWPYGASERLQTFPLRPGYQFVHRPDAPVLTAQTVDDDPDEETA